MQLAGDYGANAASSRQGALQRRNEPYGAVGSGLFGAAGSGLGLGRSSVGRKTRTRGMITTGSSGKYSKPRSAPPPAANPGPIDPNAWLGSDVGYQDQLRQFAKALTDFQSDVTRRRGDIGTDYTTSTKALGDQRVLDLKNIESDFGSRGLIHSGLYGKNVGDYENEYNKRLSDLTTNRDQILAQLLQEQNQYTTQQELEKQAAREAALKRRAETLGVV